MLGSLGKNCIFPIFPEGGTLASLVRLGSGSISVRSGPAHWCSWLSSAGLQPPGASILVFSFPSDLIPSLAETQVMGKVRKKGKKGKRERLSSKGK